MNGSSWIFLNGGAWWVAGIGAAAALALVSGLTSGRGLPRRRRALLLALRVAAVLLAGAAVLRPARETELTRIRKHPLPVVVDDTRSMALAGAAPAQSAAEWLRDFREKLPEIDRYYRVEWLTVEDPPGTLDPQAVTGPESFVRNRTPLGAALEEAARRHPDSAAMVVFTDGRDTERPGEEPPALGFPVYAVAAEGTPAKDLWIEGVDTPPVAFIRTPVEIRVRIGAAGFPPGSVTATLLEGGQPLESVTAKIGEDGGEVPLTFTPRRTGRKAYRVEITARPGEQGLENNRAQFALNVIRDKTRVLLVAGTPTWDVKFLRSRLRQDPSVDLITFLILRTPRDLVTVAENEMSLIPFPTEELFNAELPSFDAVIFANFDHFSYVPRHYLDNMVRFVRESGGGFVMLGGDRSFTLGGYEGTPIAEILPVDMAGAPPGREYRPGPFRPRLTEAGERHPIFQWESRPEANRALWNGLPELSGLNWALRARPGAMVVAENPDVRNEYGAAPVIALGEYGAGRTMAVTTDSLWRWKFNYAAAGGGEAVYRDFWGRTLRWLVHDPDMDLVRLALPPEDVRAGTRIRFTARVLDRFYRPAEDASLKGQVFDEKGRAQPLAWTRKAPGEYVSEPFHLRSEGLWRVSVEALQGSALLGRDEAGFPVAGASPEPLRTGVDGEYLEALAKKNGGEVFPAKGGELFRRLAERGRAQQEVVGRKVEEPWATPWLLAAAILLFALDWALRRVWE